MNDIQLGKYQLIEEIGHGGFARVYRALDTRLNRAVALKVLENVNERAAARFQQEAQILAQLRHPNMVTVFDVGEERGRLFIALELADGPNLAQRLKENGPLPWPEALALLRPIYAALAEVHQQGLVHGDIKPGNILLDSKRGPLLADFGLARLLHGETSNLDLSREAPGGTAAYASPEIWQGQPVGPAADIYALGCLVPELLTGQRLFPGDTAWAVIAAQQRGPQFPAIWPPGVPAGLTAVLQKALAQHPADRYPSAGAFGEALAQLRPSTELKESQSGKTSPQIGRIWAIGLALLALLCLGAMGLVWQAGSWFAAMPAVSPTTTTTFLYQVRVQDQITVKAVANASLILEVGGQMPLTSISDSDGIAAFSLAKAFSGQPGRLYVETSGYQRISRNVALLPDSLPEIIQLAAE